MQGQNIIIVDNLTWQNKFTMIMILLLKIKNYNVQVGMYIHRHIYVVAG